MKRNKLRTVLVAMGLLALAALNGMAAEASLDLPVFSHYVWRGQVLNDEAVFQPSLTVSGPWGLSFNTWANMDLTDNFDNSGEFTEVDLTVAYALPLEGPVGVEVGVVEFLFPKEGDFSAPLIPEGHPPLGITLPEGHPTELSGEDLDTGEVFAKVSVETLLSPTLSVNYDFDEVEGFYVNAGISHSIDLVEKTTLDLGASLGFGDEDYNASYFGSDEAALNDGNVSATVSYAFSETLSLAGQLQYTAMLDSDIEEGAEATYGEKDVVYGGVTLSASF